MYKFNPFTQKLDLVNPASSPGGSDTQIQFNNGGVFGGDSNLVWDNTNKFLGIGKSPSYPLDIAGDLRLTGTIRNTGTLLLTSATGNIDMGLSNTGTSTNSFRAGSGNSFVGSCTLNISLGFNQVINNASNILIGSFLSATTNAGQSTQIGQYHTDDGSSNVMVGFQHQCTATSIASNLFGTLLSADNVPTYGANSFGAGDYTNMAYGLNNMDGSLMFFSSSTKPTMTITVSAQTGTPVTGLGRILMGTTTDNGTDLLQVNGTIRPTGYKSSDGSAGISTTITTASLVGKTITIKNGLITGFA